MKYLENVVISSNLTIYRKEKKECSKSKWPCGFHNVGKNCLGKHAKRGSRTTAKLAMVQTTLSNQTVVRSLTDLYKPNDSPE